MTWERFSEYYMDDAELGFALDISRMNFPDGYLERMSKPMEGAFAAMAELERGAIANPDEGRMVGHYWLRAPQLAPDEATAQAIEETLQRIGQLADRVHSGALAGAGGDFTDLLVIGIGGSALGPQFVAQALGHPQRDKLAVHFFDNTDPDGMARTLAALEGRLGTTLSVVISKSGGTPETRNGMLTAQAAYEAAGLAFGKHAVAITGEGSKLDKYAEEQGFLARFPMWDWVGGRTSELGPVGLMPAALQGLDITGMLRGAAQMDALTRQPQVRSNPAALLALMWYYATDGRGAKDMVVLPYKDRLELFSKYLQQLVMESLGKELDLEGRIVHQGISVYGNKGSTDQHAYVQQLREGVPNFFAVFIEVLTDTAPEVTAVEVDAGVTAGDYLQGFYLGTREALYGNGRESVTITVDSMRAETVGLLIALFERAVGLYASLVGINAYHQPGVEAGKKAAASVLELKQRLVEHLQAQAGEAVTAASAAEALDASAETLFKLLRHLSANAHSGVTIEEREAGTGARFVYRA